MTVLRRYGMALHVILTVGPGRGRPFLLGESGPVTALLVGVFVSSARRRLSCRFKSSSTPLPSPYKHGRNFCPHTSTALARSL
jgi:hypothetical protein